MMSDEDPGYTSGYYGWKSSSQHKAGSFGWMGAKQREWDAEQQRFQNEQFERRRKRGDYLHRIPGESLYKLLAFGVFLVSGWFGLALTQWANLSGWWVVGVTGGASLAGWRVIHLAKSPLIAVLAGVETLIRWVLGAAIIVFLIVWIVQ